MGEVLSREALAAVCTRVKKAGKRVVFTNGCFDILHRGHVDYLTKAKALGDLLVVGVNGDDSVRRLKGPNRPVVNQDDRAAVLAALAAVDYVSLFDEDTPFELIRAIVPDVLVKGADWSVEAIVGKDVVEAAGGTVQTLEFLPNRSTSSIIQKIIQAAAPHPHER
ncbi:MAG: D-glycero-beta-D-manno-heptose 1-phosphate adenylyltransferase [Ignavibacteriales bacterium]|nr:D-glycero-beta-D-manno-heptose 1-phosphate adenylyltransferase [Ignavibacteriales bacterium]